LQHEKRAFGYFFERLRLTVHLDRQSFAAGHHKKKFFRHGGFPWSGAAKRRFKRKLPAVAGTD
jgi:hypothetical protein